jgi:hypothetical protein
MSYQRLIRQTMHSYVARRYDVLLNLWAAGMQMMQRARRVPAPAHLDGRWQRGAGGVTRLVPDPICATGSLLETQTRAGRPFGGVLFHDGILLCNEPDCPEHWRYLIEWVPCPGGCGKLMPPGQKCFDCAARVVTEWRRGGW